ncbi:MAG: EpsG family protein [Bergeyella cardium]
MPILHPVFLIAILALIVFSFMETYASDYKNYKGVWVVIVFLIILSGLREDAGADYGVYAIMYRDFGVSIDYSELLEGTLFRENKLPIEWLYSVIGKVFFSFGLPFFIFTLFLAIVSVGIKYLAFEQSVVYPALSMLLYLFPSYFTGDSGHMRQAFAMGILMFSFLFIKKRNLLMFLIMVYLAMGFHKSSAVFVLAYWIAIVPMNRITLLGMVLISVLLSPFQIYNYISIFESLAPVEVYSGFSAYSTIEGDTSTIKFTDLISIMYMFFVYFYDKDACKQIPYYEYMRNIGVFGICLYFIFRGSPIFSGRLAAIYLVFMVMVIPNIIAAIKNLQLRRGLHFIVIAYVVFYCIVYTVMQGQRAGFTIEHYRNYLW